MGRAVSRATSDVMLRPAGIRGRGGSRATASLASLVLLTTAATATAAPTDGLARATGPGLAVAVVVGSNHSPSPTQDNLRFGDDDAIQNARTLGQLGARTTLLVSPDAETRELYPALQPQGPATRAALRTAFKDAADQIATARAAGRPTRLYFLFAGHGDMADGRPFLQLDDARLWREDLAELLTSVDADDNHVLVDACYAAAFVADRGPGGQRARLAPGFSQNTDDIWPPRTGFLTARSSGGQTHEWAEYQAGVFSHELRSGLIGAADVNLDGKVSYREIAAFVQRANEAIPNRRYRPEVSTVPPDGDLDRPLADLPDGPLVLEMDVTPPGHAFIETARGVRLADLHPGAGAPVRLRLPTDQGNLFVQQGRDAVAGSGPAGPPGPAREFQVVARAGRLRLSSLSPAAPRVRARGAAHEAFLMLFSHPFDGQAVESFQLPPSEDPAVRLRRDQAASSRRALGKTALGIGVASAVGAGACALTTLFIKHSDSPANSQQDITTRNDWIKGLNVATWTLAGVAAVGLGTGAVLLLSPGNEPPPVDLMALPGGGLVGYRGRF